MISQKSVQEVLSIAQVQDIIGDYVDLKRRGVNMIGLCPFHDEKTPSFTVSPTKNIYKCFGCGKGGGAPQFLMEHDKISFPEAIRQLAQKYNIEIEEDKRDDSAYLEEKQKTDSLHIINQYALDYFKNNLFNSTEGKSIGLSYFKERGFLDKTIETFELGYALKDGKALLDDALKKSYKKDLLIELGLVGSKGYDFFRERVMFPIHNQSGKVIAFSGRILDKQKKTAKYINSPESEVYNKRKTLYGIHLAKKSIVNNDVCFIVEGYSDVISLYQAGIENVVASSGTALTNEQIRLLKRFTRNVILLYDSDPAGLKASIRGIDLLLAQDFNTFLVTLPQGEDPDSFVSNKGFEGFNAFVEEEKKDFIFFKSDLLLGESKDDPIKRSQAVKEIISSLAKIPDPIKRDAYVKRCSELMDIPEVKIVRELDKALKQEYFDRKQQKQREAYRNNFKAEQEAVTETKKEENIVSSTSLENTDYYQEKDLARLVIQYGDKKVETDGEEISLAEYIYAQIHDVLEFFDVDMYQEIITEGFKLSDRDINIRNHFLQHTDSKVQQFAINSLADPYEYADWEKKDVFLQTQKPPDLNFLKDSYQSILRFKFRKIKKVLKLLQKKITDENESEEERILHIKAYQKIQEEKSKIAMELRTVIE